MGLSSSHFVEPVMRHLDTVFGEFLVGAIIGAALVGDTEASSSGLH